MSTGEQLRLAGAAGPNLALFSEHFLEQRLPKLEGCTSIDPAPFSSRLGELWAAEREGLTASGGANEAQTEKRWIQPVFEALGYEFIVQSSLQVAGSHRQPDYALFLEPAEAQAAKSLHGAALYSNAAAVADAKRFDRPLRGRSAGGGTLSADPESQIIHYVSITKCRWGLLTNGRLWRLYGAEGDLVEGACHEVDLIAALATGDPEDLREFLALFGAQALRPDQEGLSFLDRALDESAAAAEAVGEGLERQIFAAVPLVAQGLLGEAERTREALDTALEHALVILYRLLFCLHAEARGLLPVSNPHYRDYSLLAHRRRLGEDLARGRRFSSRSDDLYNDLRSLFRIVDAGDPDLGVNEYDGRLFAAEAHPWLHDRVVPDDLLAAALDRIYRIDGHQIDYRDLSARHLGTIYERLLAYQLEPAEEGNGLELADSPRRKYTGSFFTPRPIVDRIVERTLKPLLDGRSQEVEEAGATGEEALEMFLELRVLDPAMGSGHFLVSAAAHIAQHIANDPSYAESGGLDRLELQRRVAERCLYGVDLIPMAVELARLALWLTTVRGDAPLTFLHNLRAGDSLVGADLAELLEGGETVFSAQLARDAERMLSEVGELDAEVSVSGTAVKSKRSHAAAIAELRQPLDQIARQSLAGVFSDPDRPMFNWELEFPAIFLDEEGRRRSGAGFDAIIGNPPYIRIQEFGRDLAGYCRGRYRSARGSFDAYIVFIERGLELLAPDGRLGFIVPSKFTKLEAGSGLRELLTESGVIEEVIDFGDAQLFAGATNYTCILVLDRGGGDALSFRRLPSSGVELREALLDPGALPVTNFEIGSLGGPSPWILVPSHERHLLDAITSGSERLENVTEGIFTGLQTSADPVYIIEDRGRRGGRQVVYSKASERELELEPDLLHPLASGAEVEPYAFRPLRQLLIFPYKRDEGGMHLLSPDELAALPATFAYLEAHEEALRGREGGRMDHEGWYAFGRTQSLGHHERPKLGVPRLCERLRASFDPDGEVYLDNVDVNGILPTKGGPSPWVLLALVNSHLVDWVFQRLSVPFRGSFLSANKQFIAPLPIRLPPAAEGEALDTLGRKLHDLAAAREIERRGFHDWLAGELGARIPEMKGAKLIGAYDRASADELLEALRKNRKLLSSGLDRSRRETILAERAGSLERLDAIGADFAAARAETEDMVSDLYGLTRAQREQVAADRPAG